MTKSEKAFQKISPQFLVQYFLKDKIWKVKHIPATFQRPFKTIWWFSKLLVLPPPSGAALQKVNGLIVNKRPYGWPWFYSMSRGMSYQWMHNSKLSVCMLSQAISRTKMVVIIRLYQTMTKIENKLGLSCAKLSAA